MFNQKDPRRSAEEKIGYEEESLLVDAMFDILLAGGMPDEKKEQVRVLKAYKRVGETLKELTSRFADPDKDVPIEASKEAAEYLMMVDSGLRQYMKEAGI